MRQPAAARQLGVACADLLGDLVRIRFRPEQAKWTLLIR
jgi:hypothetical protein